MHLVSNLFLLKSRIPVTIFSASAKHCIFIIRGAATVSSTTWVKSHTRFGSGSFFQEAIFDYSRSKLLSPAPTLNVRIYKYHKVDVSFFFCFQIEASFIYEVCLGLTSLAPSPQIRMSVAPQSHLRSFYRRDSVHRGERDCRALLGRYNERERTRVRIYILGKAHSAVQVEKHAWQFPSDLRNKNLFLITNRNLSLQELGTGQAATYSLATTETLICTGWSLGIVRAMQRNPVLKKKSMMENDQWEHLTSAPDLHTHTHTQDGNT